MPDDVGLPSISTPPVNLPQQNVLPPTSPVQNPMDIASIVQQVSNLPAYQGPASQLANIGQQEQGITNQMAQMPQPKYGPSIQHGAGFLHNLGQALLMAGGMTGLGRGLEQGIYGPGIASYNTKQHNLANQLASLRGQEEVPTEELRGVTGLANAGGLAGYRSGMIDVKNRQADTAQQKADAYTQSVNNRLQIATRGLDLNALRTGSQVELNKLRGNLLAVMPQIEQERVANQQEGIELGNATRQAISNLESQLGIDKSHPVAQMIDSLFGTSVTPSAPQSPAGAQPVQGQNPPPKRTPSATPSKKGGSEVTHIWTPQGLQPAGGNH